MRYRPIGRTGLQVSEIGFGCGNNAVLMVKASYEEQRNAVRRVVTAEQKKDLLLLTVQRFGQSKATKLEICRDRDRRTPAARHAARDGTADHLRHRRLHIDRRHADFRMRHREHPKQLIGEMQRLVVVRAEERRKPRRLVKADDQHVRR